MADTATGTTALPNPDEWLNKQQTAAPAASNAAGLPDPDAWLGGQQKPTAALTDKELKDSGAVTRQPESALSPIIHAGAGAASSLLDHVLGVYHILRNLPGLGDKLPPPSEAIEALSKIPKGDTFGKIGGDIETAAEYMLPESIAGKASKGLSFLNRALIHGLTSGGVGYAQSGGDPATTAIAGGAGALVPAGENLFAWIGSRLRTNPDIAFTQALRPRTSDVDFMANSPTVRGDIKQAAGKQPINDLDSLLDAVDKAKAINRGILDLHLDPARKAGITVNGSPIADAISEVPTSMHLEAQTNPAVRKQIADIYQRASAYDRPLAIDQLRALGEETNAKLNSFYYAAPDAQNAMIAQGEGKAALESKAKAIRGIFRNTFGDDASDIQRRWGLLDDVEAAAKARKNPVIMNETSARPLDEDVRKLKSILTIKQDPLSLATTPNKTNNLIKRTFAVTEPGGTLPTPPAPGTPFGYPGSAAPGRQLGAAPHVTPPPADTSGSVYNERNNPMQPLVQKTLSASTAPYEGAPGAVNVPDILGTSSRGEGTPYRLITDRPQPAIPTTGHIHITPVPADTSFAEGFPAAHGSIDTEPGLATRYEVPHQKEIFTSETDALTVPKHLREGLTLDKPREIRNAAGERYQIILRKDGKVYEYKQ